MKYQFILFLALLAMISLSICSYGQELRPVKGLNGKWGFVDETGKEMIPFKYENAGRFSEGLARVEYNSRWGFINKAGNAVISLKYYAAGDFSEGLARVNSYNRYGFIDMTGKKVIPFKYYNAGDFSEGLARVKFKGRWGFINKTGNTVISFNYEEVGSFSEGLARVKLNGKWGFIDKTGKEIIPAKYDEVGQFSEGLVRVNLSNKWGFFDKTGKDVIPAKYDAVGQFSEGLARVKLNGKWGFIDKTGKEIIPTKYDEVGQFSEGLVRVKLNGKWGFIDKTGKEVMNTDNNIMPEATDNKQQNIPAANPNVVVNPDLPESSSPQKFQFGITGGWYYTNEIYKYDGKDYYTNDYLPGFQLGFVGNVPLGKYFTLQPGLLYAQQRAVEKNGNEHEKCIINHLQIPVNFQFKLNLGNTPIYLQAGPYFGYALWGKYKWKYEVAEGKFESGSNDIKIGNSRDDAFKPLDCGISSGIALKAGNIQFGFNSMVGLANTSTSENKKEKEKTNGVSFSATYFLGK